MQRSPLGNAQPLPWGNPGDLALQPPIRVWMALAVCVCWHEHPTHVKTNVDRRWARQWRRKNLTLPFHVRRAGFSVSVTIPKRKIGVHAAFGFDCVRACCGRSQACERPGRRQHPDMSAAVVGCARMQPQVRGSWATPHTAGQQRHRYQRCSREQVESHIWLLLCDCGLALSVLASENPPPPNFVNSQT